MEFDNGDEVELDQRLKPEDGKNLSYVDFSWSDPPDREIRQ